jgi:hypothetical protein
MAAAVEVGARGARIRCLGDARRECDRHARCGGRRGRPSAGEDAGEGERLHGAARARVRIRTRWGGKPSPVP